jgi:hypothetical protein
MELEHRCWRGCVKVNADWYSKPRSTALWRVWCPLLLVAGWTGWKAEHETLLSVMSGLVFLVTLVNGWLRGFVVGAGPFCAARLTLRLSWLLGQTGCDSRIYDELLSNLYRLETGVGQALSFDLLSSGLSPTFESTRIATRLPDAKLGWV